MSAQLPLTFDRPRSRRSDPSSSQRAEEKMRASGALKGQQLIALSMVRANPGRTSKELGSIGPLDRYQVARRLPELEAMNLVYRVESDVEDCRWWVK
jgi:DNA-binding MarR family transcriptional regulator